MKRQAAVAKVRFQLALPYVQGTVVRTARALSTYLIKQLCHAGTITHISEMSKSYTGSLPKMIQVARRASTEINRK